MNTEVIANDRQRFAHVMKARRTDRELLDLFGKLALSDKFSDEAKPYCYADLIWEGVRRLADKNVPLLLETVEQCSAAKKVRAALPAAKADKVLRELVKRAFTCSRMEEGPLMSVFMWSERTGVGSDRCHTVCLGLEAGMPMEVMDDICDLTVYAYYPTLPRRAPVVEQAPVAERLAA